MVGTVFLGVEEDAIGFDRAGGAGMVDGVGWEREFISSSSSIAVGKVVIDGKLVEVEVFEKIDLQMWRLIQTTVDVVDRGVDWGDIEGAGRLQSTHLGPTFEADI